MDPLAQLDLLGTLNVWGHEFNRADCDRLVAAAAERHCQTVTYSRVMVPVGADGAVAPAWQFTVQD